MHPGANHTWGERQQNACKAYRPCCNHAASAHVAEDIAQNTEDEAGDEPLIIESHPSVVPPLEEEPQSQVDNVMMDKVQVPVAVAQPATRKSMAHSWTWGMSGWTAQATNNKNQAMTAPTVIVASAATAPTAPTAVAENTTPNELQSLHICFEGKDVDGREERLLAYLCCIYDTQVWNRSTVPPPLHTHLKTFLEAETAYHVLLFGQTLLLQKGFSEAELPEIESALKELGEVTYFSNPLQFRCPTCIYRKSNRQTEALHKPVAFSFMAAESHNVQHHPDKDKLWKFICHCYEQHKVIEQVQLPSKEQLCKLWAKAQRIINDWDIEELQRRSAPALCRQPQLSPLVRTNLSSPLPVVSLPSLLPPVPSSTMRTSPLETSPTKKTFTLLKTQSQQPPLKQELHEFSTHACEMLCTETISCYVQDFDEQSKASYKLCKPANYNGIDPQRTIINEHNDPNKQRLPLTLVAVSQLCSREYNKPLFALPDTGSQYSFIQKRVLPQDAQTSKVHCPVQGITRSVVVTKDITFQGIMLPELSRSKRIDAPFHVMVHETMSSYDLILGLDFLCSVGIHLLCVKNQIQWGENFQVYQPCVVYSEGKLFAQTIKAFAHDDTKDNPEGLGYMSHHILDAKYEAVDTNNVAKQQTQSSPQ